MYQFTKDDNTLKRHFQMMVEREDFLEQIGNWLELYGDKRLLLLRHLVFEIDMSETEQLKETLYEYGSYLTEKNYCGRKLFSMIAVLIGQLEASNNMKIQEYVFTKNRRKYANSQLGVEAVELTASFFLQFVLQTSKIVRKQILSLVFR